MNKLIRNTMLFLFVILSTISYAQSDFEIKWSDIEHDSGLTEIVSAKDEVVIVKGEKLSLIQKPVVFLTRFDTDHRVTNSISIEDIHKQDYFNVGTIDSPEGIAHFFYDIGQKKPKINIYAQLYHRNDLKKGEKLKLHKFDFNSKKVYLQLESNKISTNPIEMFVSPDRSKVCLLMTQEKATRDKVTNYQFVVFDVNNQFEIINEGEIFTDKKSKYYEREDISLNNNGLLVVLMKEYFISKNQHTSKSKPASKYELHYLQSPSNRFIYDIIEDRYFLEGIELIADEDNNVFVSAPLRVKSGSKVLGDFVMKIDKDGNEVYKNYKRFSFDELDSVNKKHKDYISSEFEYVDVLQSDSLLFVINQNQAINNNYNNNTFRPYNGYYNNSYPNNNRSSYYFENRTIIVETFSKMTGEKINFTIIPFAQEELQKEFKKANFAALSPIVINNQLFIFYNETLKNLDRIKENEKIRRQNISYTKNVSVMVSFDEEGDLFIKDIDKEDRFSLLRSNVFIENEKIFFLQSSARFDRYTIGKLIYK